MRIFLIWVFLSLLAAVIANGKGRSAFKFFFLSMFFSPVVGLFAAFIVPQTPLTQKRHDVKSDAQKKCPSCDGVVMARDTVCRFCQKPLPEIIEVEATVE